MQNNKIVKLGFVFVGFIASSMNAWSDVRLARWDGTVSDAKAWNDHVLKSLETSGESLLVSEPKDIKDYCPGYSKMNKDNRKKFWLHLISSIANFESSFKPQTRYKENFKDQNGNEIWSRGLMQISYQSSQPYGCGFKNSEALHDAKANLTCAIKILNRWVRQDGVVATGDGKDSRGAARYWSVMRSGKYSKTTTIKGWTQEFCKSL